MYLTKDNIAANGTLFVKRSEVAPYDHAYVYGCYRFFYALDEGANAPEDLADRDNDGVPDYVENMLYKLETARILLTESFHLKDPLLSGFFHAKGAKFIDVYLNDIPREHGLASGTVFDERHEILDGSAFQGKSLKLTLHRNLKARTETPLHELFHLFQFNYSQFNNPWFMEGLGRWSQRIISEGSGKEETLPSTIDELEALLNKSHEAEFFWNRLSSLCDKRGTFVIPESLRKNDEIANNARPGVKLIKAVLENSERQCRLIEEKFESRHLSGLAYWPREEKRSLANNKHILLAVYDAIQACTDGKNEELSTFLNTITLLTKSVTANFDTPDINNFVSAPKKCNGNYVNKDVHDVLYSDCIDPLTLNVSIPALEHSDLPLTDIAQAAKINSNLDCFANTAIQEFIQVLQKTCNRSSSNPFSYLDIFDARSGTLLTQTLEFTGQILSNQDLATFCVVRHIVGNLTLSDNSVLTSLVGLDNLESIEGNLTISKTAIQHISGLNMLVHVRGKIAISNNQELTTINGFTSLRIAEAPITITHNPELSTINGFNSLQQICDGELAIEQCLKLTSINGFCNLILVKNISLNRLSILHANFLNTLFKQQSDFIGFIKITYCKLENLSCFSQLKSVGSSFYLHGNKLSNLYGLESLQTVGASFSLGSNQLVDISQLCKLTTINGLLNLSSNRLTSLHGLENLQSIKTTLWNRELLTIKIENNKNSDGRFSLTDISALANVQEVNKNIILLVDAEHTYDRMPPESAQFYSNSIKTIEYKLVINASFTAILSLPAYKAHHNVPILFSNRWQSVLSKCSWLKPFCEDIREPDKIIEFCKQNNIQLIFANTLWLQYALLENKSIFYKNGLRFLTNNKFSLDHFKDKGLFYDFMKKNNLLEYIPIHFSSIDSHELLGIPYIVKPRISSNSDGVRLVLPGEKLDNINSNSLIAEYVEGGEEYASNILFNNGEIIKHVSYKKTYGESALILSPETRGKMRNERCEPECMGLFKHILSLANPDGGYCLCCIDYKLVGKTPKIFEINARMGYTLACHPADFTEMMNVYIEQAYAFNQPVATSLA